MALLTPVYAREIGLELPVEDEGEAVEKKKKSNLKKKRSKAEMVEAAKHAVAASMRPFRPGDVTLSL